MDPFEAALDALFHAPGSLAALYVSVSGPASPIRVICRQRVAEIGTVRPIREVSGRLIDIRRSEIPNPQIGDAVLFSGSTFVVSAPPEIDAEGLTWTCEVPKLERVVSVLRAAPAPNSYGDHDLSMQEIATVQAARVDQTGRESDGQAATGNQITAWRAAAFFALWDETVASIRPADRLVDGGDVFDIQSIAEIGLRIGVEITAIARAE
ncbi:MAG TPA: head-tail adaptor protein [Sphingomonas sp.]|jgi:hypothetical protein|uniref:head-tail joining protein n=1 Tax=Sphingomonas sp. TaxID=28214 RepID=UPI002EDACC70